MAGPKEHSKSGEEEAENTIGSAENANAGWEAENMIGDVQHHAQSPCGRIEMANEETCDEEAENGNVTGDNTTEESENGGEKPRAEVRETDNLKTGVSDC
jgi:hypothetical protein